MNHTSIEDQVSAVLAGTLRYDDADADAQDEVRSAWEADLERRASGLDLVSVFLAEGRTTWVTATADGTPLLAGPGTV